MSFGVPTFSKRFVRGLALIFFVFDVLGLEAGFGMAEVKAYAKGRDERKSAEHWEKG